MYVGQRERVGPVQPGAVVLAEVGVLAVASVLAANEHIHCTRARIRSRMSQSLLATPM